ncbi:uncharacterized protein N7443_006072 [Penicillium atrosanguineum]|uniref:uncharacterized protein n=1 Tax=Penicillium atrosanguineum TaxID=1132637 RepID=UPI0023A03B07|nr:uncharacterized protein N7443_006072 [Penicillium atrosanguineum]KAJ5301070.1 hypothetical protein N7443_006072 [Penicillium atrosanguineum]
MKGFVGGIPIALLAVAAQAMEHTGHGVVPHIGGTAMGGPSGADHDGGFIPMSPNVHTHTDVNEYSKDDHSINIKTKGVYPPPATPIPYGVAMAPGMGPFSKAGGKRSWPHGGTAMGGPSGNDEGQVFDMPITGNFYTSVDEETKDDHSIKLKNENIHAPPAHPPIAHPPPVFVHSPGPGSGFREAKQDVPEHYHVPGQAFEKRWGPEEGGTAMGGPSGGDGPSDGPEGFPYPIQAGGTAMGGPSGEDDGIEFDNGIHADFHTNVNEYSHDDHSIDIKHTDIYPPPPPHFGPPGFGGPFKRSWETEQSGWEPESGGTAMGGPSGNDGGQEFNMPITINTETAVKESYADDHSIDIKHKDVYPHPPAFPEFGGPGPVIPQGGPFKRAYSPSSEERTAGGGGGGTAEGGPSGEDDGINFGDPTDVGVDSNVSEHHEDNHAIKIDDTNVHNPEMPWMHYHEPPASAPASAPQPAEHEQSPPMVEHEQSPPMVEHEQSPPIIEHEEAPACAPEIHNVVHTVTKTATHVVQETATVTETGKDHIVNQVQTVHETATVTEPAKDHIVNHVQTIHETHTVHNIHTVYVTPSEHVVHVTDTVTAPAAHLVEATETVYASPSHVVETLYASPSHVVAAAETVYASPSHVVETQAIAWSQAPMVTPVSKIAYSSHIQSMPVSGAPSSYMAQESYNYHPQAPASSAYSMIPVEVPMASPSSSMAPMAMPSGVDPMHSSMASASATPSHGVMFTGDAARLSGGIISAAAAVMGVLAFIL